MHVSPRTSARQKDDVPAPGEHEQKHIASMLVGKAGGRHRFKSCCVPFQVARLRREEEGIGALDEALAKRLVIIVAATIRLVDEGEKERQVRLHVEARGLVASSVTSHASKHVSCRKCGSLKPP
eukprot:1335619-Pleurochrysis_carterae.AAC.7